MKIYKKKNVIKQNLKYYIICDVFFILKNFDHRKSCGVRRNFQCWFILFRKQYYMRNNKYEIN